MKKAEREAKEAINTVLNRMATNYKSIQEERIKLEAARNQLRIARREKDLIGQDNLAGQIKALHARIKLHDTNLRHGPLDQLMQLVLGTE